MPQFNADDGASIAYDVTGEGEAILFVHGWDANRRFFDDQVKFFAPGHKVVAMDLRGHGESDRGPGTEQGLTMARCARDVRNLISHLGLRNPTVAAWSMGTSIMLDYVRQWGCDGIGKLCIIDMTPKLHKAPDWDLAAMGGLDDAATLRFLAAVARDWDGACDKIVPTMFAKSRPVEPRLLSWVREQVRNNTPHCLIALWISMALADYREVLASISVPTLLTFGGDGYFYGERHGHYMQDHIARSHLVMFEDCGHALHMEDGAKFNRELAAFLA